MSNSVDIYINGHERDLLQAIERTKAAIASLRDSKATVTVDVDDGALNALKAKLAAMRDGDVTVDVNVNDAKLAALRGKMDALRNTRVKVTVDVDRTELNILKAELAGLRDRSINVDIDSDLAGFRAALAASTLGNANARINLDLDTSTAAAELAAFIAAVPRNVTINLDVDTAGAAAELAAFRLALLALNDDTIRLGTNAGGSAASGLAKMGGSAGAAAPLLAAMTTALAPLISGAAGAGVFATAAGLGAVTAAAGAMSVGVGGALAAIPIISAATSQKVQDHFTFMKDDVVNTMKEISEPVQQPLVDLATSVGAAFHQIRPSLDVVTAGAARLVGELSGKMPAIAAEVGPAMEKAFGAAEPHIKNLISNVPSYIQAFGNFTEKLGDPAIVQGAQRVFGMIPGIIDGAGDSIVSMAKGFENVMGFLDSGALDGFTSGIGSFFDEMGSADFSGTVDGIADMANAFGDLVGSIDGESVTGFLEGITGDITKFTEAAKAVGDIGSSIGDFLSDQAADAASLGQMLNLDAFGDEINGFLDKIGLIEWSGKPIEIPTELKPPTTDPNSLAGLVAGAFGGSASGGGIPIPVEPTLPATLPPLPLLGEFQEPAPPPPPSFTIPLTGELEPVAPPSDMPPVPLGITFDGQVPPPPEVAPVVVDIMPGPMPPPPAPVAPVEVPLTPAPLPPPPPPPAPVEIQTEVSLENIAMPDIPPLKVPVQYDTAGIGSLTIQPPPPVKVPVEIDTGGAKVDLSAQGAAAGNSFASGLAGSAGAVSAAAASMAAAAQGVSVDLSAQGSAAGASFAAGLASQAGAVAAAAANLGAVAAANKGVYKGRKGIAADRIMLIPHGQAMVRGFIDGLGSQRRELITEASSLAQAVTKRFDEELVPNIGLSGGVGVQQVVHVTVEAGLMADPVVIGREVRDVLGAYASAVGGSETISV
ncbi:hypothetical protein CH298_04320 [Rhodococcoides fascians]|uniref:hypothetical protein n=1 Tax=Rhodococcoides fascians TaxID=1828 RepID=UPI000B9B4484|nr:hypothetical protein [Rhodococcus fascians]OZE92731.1 hypothetical protein CH303_04315 [Rhodococcus fascians]OZF23364.1 hypothetical protein CH298_04320 [Rhodococcus fascians]OZF25077.1 hypothetical protein CH297_04315 [Rhodococcus fascians]OZF72673.1 hypothetical protein CH308_04320 [Rhodococcus fascians]OZF73972.1 hypothetical protein CH307_04320 [Rhodococcus fascians]